MRVSRVCADRQDRPNRTPLCITQRHSVDGWFHGPVSRNVLVIAVTQAGRRP